MNSDMPESRVISIKQILINLLDDREICKHKNPYYLDGEELTDDVREKAHSIAGEISGYFTWIIYKTEDRFYRWLIKALYILLLRRIFRKNGLVIESATSISASSALREIRNKKLSAKDKAIEFILLEYNELCHSGKPIVEDRSKTRLNYFP